MLGERLKSLRESKGLVQRQVAVVLGVDTAYISKMESNEKPMSKQYVKKLSSLLDISERELYTIWLAEKILKAIEEEDHKEQALKLALKSLK